MPSKTIDNAPQPQGLRLNNGISYGKLSPLGKEAGRLAQKGTPTLCGWISGFIMATRRETKETSDNLKYGPYTRFIGEFFAKRHPTGEEIDATEIYVPASVERFLEAAFAGHGPRVPVALEIWAVPDESENNNLHWKYATYLRQAPGKLSKARQLAIASGIIEAPPQPPAQAIEGPGTYDPETGEVLADAAE